MSTEYLPDCWKEDSRMNALFSPFRSRDANPQDWESKVTFWRNCIVNWCRASNRVSFTVNGLMSAFERQGKTPQGLRTTVVELLRKKDIVKLSDYGDLEDGSTWLSWGLNTLVKKPLIWSFSAMSSALVRKDPDEEEYLFLEILKEKANEVLKIHEIHVEFETTDHVIDMTTLKDQCSGVCCSEAEFYAVLLHLRKEKNLTCHFTNEMKLVKFKRKDEKVASPVTEVDMGILRLKTSREFLKNRILKLQDKIENHVLEARTYLKENSKTMARAALRRKKLSENVLAKRETALENIDELLNRIQEVESEKMVIDAYHAGVEGFKQTLAESGITLDKVDDTMIAIQEMFDMQEDIQDTISQPIGGETDMSELEMELEELMSNPEPPPPFEPPPPPEDKKDEEAEKRFREMLEAKSALPSEVDVPEVPLFPSSGGVPNSSRPVAAE